MDEAYRQRLNAWSDERRSELASQAALWFSADGVTAPPTTPMGMYAPLQRSMAAFSDLPLAEEFLPTELAGTRKLSSLSGAPRVTSIIQSLMTAVDYFGDVLSMWDSDGGRSMAQIATGVVDPRGHEYVYWHFAALVSTLRFSANEGERWAQLRQEAALNASIPITLMTLAYCAETPIPDGEVPLNRDLHMFWNGHGKGPFAGWCTQVIHDGHFATRTASDPDTISLYEAPTAINLGYLIPLSWPDEVIVTNITSATVMLDRVATLLGDGWDERHLQHRFGREWMLPTHADTVLDRLAPWPGIPHRLSPESDGPYGEHLLLNGQDYKARVHLRRAVENGDTQYEELFDALDSALEGDPVSRYQLGNFTDEEGRPETAMRWFARAARRGLPQALGSFTWHMLKAGEHERGIAFYDDVIQACVAWVRAQGNAHPNAEYELANARCNDALNRLAMGAGPRAAMDVWAEGQRVGHEESRIYPAVLASRQGRDAEAQNLVAAMSPEFRREAIELLQRFAASSRGWFREWCHDGLTLLGARSTEDAPGVRFARDLWASLFPANEPQQLTWQTVSDSMESPTLQLERATPPVSNVGGTTPEALPIGSVRQSSDLADALRTAGWSLTRGHDWALTIAFEGVTPIYLTASFDRDSTGRVRTWVCGTATVSPSLHGVTGAEARLLAAVFESVESREDPYPGVSARTRPQPYIGVMADHNVLIAPSIEEARYVPVENPVRSLVVGYTWLDFDDENSMATAATRAIDHLVKVIEGLNALHGENPQVFRHYMGDGILPSELAD